jgi:DNA-directed RNA polymerase specialized sigma24 family protein
MTNDTENDLIAKAAAGDMAAFEQVFMRYMPMLLAYSQAICGDYHAAQDAFVKAGPKTSHAPE